MQLPLLGFIINFVKYSDWPSITQSQTYGSRESIRSTCYSSTSIIINSMALSIVAVMTCALGFQAEVSCPDSIQH